LGEEEEELGRERMGRKSSAMLVGIIWMFIVDMVDGVAVARKKSDATKRQWWLEEKSKT